MSPLKQPSDLFKLCVKSCIGLINSACYAIESSFSEDEYNACEQQAFALKHQLAKVLPARLFDILCEQRTCLSGFRGDPRLQLQVLMHPRMAVFHKCDLDNGIPQRFWIDNLQKYSKLIVLDLKFICTDNILHIVGVNCPLLQEINIVSRLDVRKSPFNASVLIRNVSDAGLLSVAKLKQLRILAMDAPRNERAHRHGRCVSPSGVVLLAAELPLLQELRIESCDIGSTLITASRPLGPLRLRKINCHFASAEGVRKLIEMCPLLEEFSVTHLSDHDNDAKLEHISQSPLRLSKVDLSFFSYSDAMQDLLLVKGVYLTHFSLWEVDNLLNFNALLTISSCCPNLNSLCLTTQSRCLVVPRYYRRTTGMFRELTHLTLGNNNFDIESILSFFLESARRLERLVLQYEVRKSVDATLLQLLQQGLLHNVTDLWLDCTLSVSKQVVRKLVEGCSNLQKLTVDFGEDVNDIQKYVADHNLDLKLGMY